MALVWGLLGHRRGDNQQVAALCARLGWPYELKQLHFGEGSRDRNLYRRARPIGIDVDPTTPIVPPWPEIVISVGYRSVPLALHIRERSGGSTRLVQLGRPRAPHGWFDLIVTTPQYRMPAVANVLEIPLPLGSPPPQAGDLPPDLARLPRPRLAVLVGGPTKELQFDVAQARELAERINRLVAGSGSALVTTSPRTTPAIADVLRERISVPHVLNVFRPDGPNPYAAYLAAADQILVTGDSVSMIADACHTPVPVRLFPLPEKPNQKRRRASLYCEFANRLVGRRDPISRLMFAVADSGLFIPGRDYSKVHRTLAQRGMLTGFDGAPSGEPTRRPAEIAEWENEVVARVRSLADPAVRA